MTSEERLQKAIRKVNSAIIHVRALPKNDKSVYTIIGDLKRAMNKLHTLNYEQNSECKTITQMELF